MKNDKIGIIGTGFSGMMTAVQLIRKSKKACEIILIDKEQHIGRGTAYNPYSNKHLLNVSAKKMSAFPDTPEHFLDWVMQQDDYADKDRALIANAYLPRKLYGDYLGEIWKETEELAKTKGIKVSFIQSGVNELSIVEDAILLSLHNNAKLIIDQCVIATGNNVPSNPRIENMDFYQSQKYFRNPWKIESVQNVKEDLPVLIIGNGLTMVDAVFGLLEQGFKGDIYSISPNGFKILPHRHGGLKYSKLVEELRDDISLYEMVKLIIKHTKAVKVFGISAEPVINSLRPHTQKIWQSFTYEEKRLFVLRYRHLWGVARHRLPMHSHDKIQQMRIDEKLRIISGKLINLKEDDRSVIVDYYNKKEKRNKTLQVSRVINCTGPSRNLMEQGDSFLKRCLLNGIFTQDKLKLGINTNVNTFQILDSNGSPHSNLFTLGSNLTGNLWESTAVNELRVQAEDLANQLTVKSKVYA